MRRQSIRLHATIGCIPTLSFALVMMAVLFAGCRAASTPAATDGGASPSGPTDGSSSTPPPPDPCIAAGSCPPGQWTDVSPKDIDLSANLPCGNYGALSVQVNAAHPETLYTHFDCRGIWKSVDYGSTWNGPINVGDNAAVVSDCAGGVATPPNSATPKLYLSCIRGKATGFWASSNDGVDWTRYDVGPGGQRQDYYPPSIDPFDGDHLLMVGHEMDSLVQSTDGGRTWAAITVDPGMASNGGTSGLVFINTGDPATTRSTWLFLAQGSGGQVGTWRTTNGGAKWTRVDTNEKEHSYYQIYQPDTNGVVYMAGIYSSLGFGVLRSADYGQTWLHVGNKQNENIVFGTSKHIYALDGCCSGMGNLEVGDQPGTGAWTAPATPAGFVAPGLGVAQAAVTSDGKYNIIVTANWTAGLWRYIEPLD
jgi:hypothetical protein